MIHRSMIIIYLNQSQNPCFSIFESSSCIIHHQYAHLQVLGIVNGFADHAPDEVEKVQVVPGDVRPGVAG